MTSRLKSVAAAVLLAQVAVSPALAADVTRYIRYEHAGKIAYGILDGTTIRELSGDLFGTPEETGATMALGEVTVLPPTVPSKVIAVGLNYKSHSGGAGAGGPGLFAKLPSSLIGDGANIVIPPGATNVHYEGELVIVIGKHAKNVAVADAHTYVFGVTAGNDVSDRAWQASDLQWIRAKASDSFGPVGPVIATGLDYDNLLVETRVNGEVRQSERTSHLIHSVDEIVSFISRYITLLPGDLIFTGTPGETRAMHPGDVVEIEVEGVGALTNKVVAAP
jgi:2-keto-4-pentenoate hydratase/2-oxohepta-3-ene-1,7-dioic acid hydratase in catechol pathway